MKLDEFWYAIEESSIALLIGGTAWFPVLESIHVVAAVMVLGSIVIVDLKLLGMGPGSYSLNSLLKELTPWSWGAFVVAVITGLGLFITRAGGYADNKAFIIKLILLLIAGANLLWFHFSIYRKMVNNGLGAEHQIADNLQLKHAEFSLSVKCSGAISLIIWCGVMLSGRWIGHLI